MADLVKGFRDALQELLVPQMRAMQEAIERNSQAITDLHREMDERFAAVEERLVRLEERREGLERRMEERFDRMDQRLLTLAEGQAEIRGELKQINQTLQVILNKLDLAERVAKVEKVLESVTERLGIQGVGVWTEGSRLGLSSNPFSALTALP